MIKECEVKGVSSFSGFLTEIEKNLQCYKLQPKIEMEIQTC